MIIIKFQKKEQKDFFIQAFDAELKGGPSAEGAAYQQCIDSMRGRLPEHESPRDFVYTIQKQACSDAAARKGFDRGRAEKIFDDIYFTKGHPPVEDILEIVLRKMESVVQSFEDLPFLKKDPSGQYLAYSYLIKNGFDFLFQDFISLHRQYGNRNAQYAYLKAMEKYMENPYLANDINGEAQRILREIHRRYEFFMFNNQEFYKGKMYENILENNLKESFKRSLEAQYENRIPFGHTVETYALFLFQNTFADIPIETQTLQVPVARIMQRNPIDQQIMMIEDLVKTRGEMITMEELMELGYSSDAIKKASDSRSLRLVQREEIQRKNEEGQRRNIAVLEAVAAARALEIATLATQEGQYQKALKIFLTNAKSKMYDLEKAKEYFDDFYKNKKYSLEKADYFATEKLFLEEATRFREQTKAFIAE